MDPSIRLLRDFVAINSINPTLVPGAPGGEVLVGVGDFVYILDVLSKRIGPVMGGQEFIALAKPFSKQLDF